MNPIKLFAGSKPKSLKKPSNKAERARYKSLKGELFPKRKPVYGERETAPAAKAPEPIYAIGKTGYFLHPDFRGNLPKNGVVLPRPSGVDDYVWREVERLVDELKRGKRPQSHEDISAYVNAVSFGPGGPLRASWDQKAYLKQLHRLGILRK